jgi:hypothetical protein
MGITISLRGGSGDMKSTDFDPDLDGKIANAELKEQPQDLTGLMEKAVFDSDGDGKIDISVINGGSNTGAVIDYLDCTDKELDSVVAEADDGGSTSYVNVGTPYTVTKADMDDKTGAIKALIAAEIHASHGAYIATAGYNINGGGDVEIGAHTGTAYTLKTVADVEAVIGDVIQFRLKSNFGTSHIQNMCITQTHGGRKALTGYF